MWKPPFINAATKHVLNMKWIQQITSTVKIYTYTHTLIYSNNSWLLFCSLSFAFAFAFSTVYFICESGDGWHFLSRMYALSRLKQALNVCSKLWHTSECDNTAIKRNSAMQRTQAHRMCAQIFSPMCQRKFLLMHKMYAKKITLRFDYTDRWPCRVLFCLIHLRGYRWSHWKLQLR